MQKQQTLILEGFENFLRANDMWWKGEWQWEAAKSICENTGTIIQGSRQLFGKTEVLAYTNALAIFGGWDNVIAFPTLQSGTSILGERIEDRLTPFGLLVGDWTMNPNNKSDKGWHSGKLDTFGKPLIEGRLRILSANETTHHKRESHTSDMLSLDEGQRYTENVLGYFAPFFAVALKEGRARFLIAGIGGHKESLIERAKLFEMPAKFKVVRWTADDLVACDPELQDVYDYYKAILPEWQWLSNFMVEPTEEGLKRMYPDALPMPDIAIALEKNYSSRFYVGIDVGYVQDLTVATVYECIGDFIIIRTKLALGNMHIKEKVKKLTIFIRASCPGISGKNMAVELNGGGFDLRDLLDDVFPRIQGVTTDAAMKEEFWEETIKKAREGIFGIADEETGSIWGELNYKTNPKNGAIEFEHSDYWMSAMVGWQMVKRGKKKGGLPIKVGGERFVSLKGY